MPASEKCGVPLDSSHVVTTGVNVPSTEKSNLAVVAVGCLLPLKIMCFGSLCIILRYCTNGATFNRLLRTNRTIFIFQRNY